MEFCNSIFFSLSSFRSLGQRHVPGFQRSFFDHVYPWKAPDPFDNVPLCRFLLARPGQNASGSCLLYSSTELLFCRHCRVCMLLRPGHIRNAPACHQDEQFAARYLYPVGVIPEYSCQRLEAYSLFTIFIRYPNKLGKRFSEGAKTFLTFCYF